jgi:hypothetical protein
VPTSSSTRVRCLRARASNNCRTSLALNTTGIFLRLALCRTNRMGLRGIDLTPNRMVENNAHEVSDLGAAGSCQGQRS